MIRLTWLQFRAQALVACGVLAVIAVALAVTGPALVHDYATNVAACQAHGDCDAAIKDLATRFRGLPQLSDVLLVVPALVGIFWGAPLIARELETGTFRLAWTQSITRRRWLGVKLGLVGLSSMAVAGLLSFMLTWWASPIDRASLNRLSPALFGERGIVPVGYAALAFTLGVTAGMLLRRTLPAMAATLVAFLGTRLAVTYWVRPHLIPPARITRPLLLPGGPRPTTLGADTVQPDSWVISDRTINAAGHVIGSNGGIGPNGGILFRPAPGGLTLEGGGFCPGLQTPTGSNRGVSGFSEAFQHCNDKLGIREVLIYQPGSRYWALQGLETAVCLGLALALAGFCFWWIRRRLT